MPKIIFLNGCINAGKSTVANRLKEIVPNLAHVEVDDLHRFASWMPIERAIHLNWENAVNVTKTFVGVEMDVVFSYPLSKSDYEYLLTRFSGVNAHFIPITLYTSLEIGKVGDVEADKGSWVGRAEAGGRGRPLPGWIGPSPR